MFLVKDIINGTSFEISDASNLINFINSACNASAKELDRINSIATKMLHKEHFSFNNERFEVVCIDDAYVIKNIWLDSVAPAPSEYYWANTVNKAKNAIIAMKNLGLCVDLISIGGEISLPHQADGGNLAAFFDWCANNGISIQYKFHDRYKGYRFFRNGQIAYANLPVKQQPLSYAFTNDDMTVNRTDSKQYWNISKDSKSCFVIKGNFVEAVNALVSLVEKGIIQP